MTSGTRERASDEFTGDKSTGDGVVRAAPRFLLRVEGALVLVAATAWYASGSFGWPLYALLFFTPDIFMLGYLRNARLGAAVYNVGHSYVSPAALYVIGLFAGSPSTQAIALIWIAHIGFDRMAGYGLKYEDAFRHTHLS